MILLNYLAVEIGTVEEYINKILKEAECRVHFTTTAATSMCKGPLILEVNETNLVSILNLIDDREEKFLIAFKDKEAFKLIEKLKMSFDKIFGFIDLSLDYEYNVPLIKNYLSINYNKSTMSLEKLSKDLDKILDFTKTELSNVKEMHDRFVKLRTENLRGAKVQIKFMAGEKSGGEFFDFIESDNEIIIIEAGSDSYITSSMIIAQVELLKLKKSNARNELEQFLKNIVHSATELNSKINYLVTVLNLNTLELTYFQRGNSKLYIEKEIKNVSGNGVLKLGRGEKVFFISEGILRNWNLYNKESELVTFLNNHFDMNTKDFINELFFELSKHKKSSFLLYDALMGVIEINQNVIHQV